MVKIGLVGLPKSGKTTIFNAVTGRDAEISDYYSADQEPNVATLTVADERLDYLADDFPTTQKINPKIEYIDFMGIKKDEHSVEVFSDKFLGVLRTIDCMALVVRGFPYQDKEIEPLKEVEEMETEFIFSDMTICENRLETIAKQTKRGVSSRQLKNEKDLLEKCEECLNEGKFLSELGLNSQQKKILSSFQFLTLKPVFVILNVDDSSYGDNQDILEEIRRNYPAIEIAGKFELELNQLDPEEAEMFMEEYSIEESALDALTKLSYDTLGLITFYTIGDDEVKAWSLKKGSTALDAAEKIHSDLAKGFIRAERFSFSDYKKYGSEKVIKDKGKFYLEGKDYQVQDGDMLKIRHN